MDNTKKKILYLCTVPATGMLPFASKIINTIAKYSDEYEIFGIFVDMNGFSYQNFLDSSLQKDKLFFIKGANNSVMAFLEKLYPCKILHQIQKICNQEHIDIIHCLTTEFSLGYYLYRLQKKVKILYIVHDLNPHEQYSWNFASKIMNFVVNRGVAKHIKNLNNLSTSSKEQFNTLKSTSPKKQIFYHPFPTLITKQIKEGKALCPELVNIDKYILFFGTLQTYKGVELLYNTFLNDKFLYENYRLVIAGGGEWYFNRDESKENKVIRINRFIDDSEVKNLFQKAACVVYPYISATQSGVLSIAYYFGTPLVVSNIPFFLENVDINQTAFVFKNGDSESLKQSIVKALNVKNNEYLIEQQRKKYDSLYSETALYESIVEIYSAI